MDLAQAVSESLEKVVASGVIEQHIQATLEKTLKSIIDDHLRSYSDFGKQLAAVVGKSLGLPEDVDLPSYNHAILQIVQRQVEAATQGSIQREVAARMKDLLTEPPAEITLSALVDQYREHVKSKVSGGCVCHGDRYGVTLHVVERDFGSLAISGDWRRIFLDDEPDKSQRECEIEIATHGGEVYSLRLPSGDVEKGMFANALRGFERMLFQMRAAKSKIVFDVPVDEIELEFEPDHY